MSLLIIRLPTHQRYLVNPGVLTEDDCGFLSRYTSAGASEVDWARFQKLMAFLRPYEILQRDLTPARVLVIE